MKYPAPLKPGDKIPPEPEPEAFGATLSSAKVFHSWQAGHCPIHLADSYPQFWQKKAVVLAFAIQFLPCLFWFWFFF